MSFKKSLNPRAPTNIGITTSPFYIFVLSNKRCLHQVDRGQRCLCKRNKHLCELETPFLLSRCNSEPGNAAWKMEHDLIWTSGHILCWVPLGGKQPILLNKTIFSFFFSFLFFLTAILVAYESFWARGWMGATAVDLCHSHSNTRSEPHLQTMPQFAAMLDP